MINDLVKKVLRDAALKRHGPDIRPCNDRTGNQISWDASYTEYGEVVTLWYNDYSGSTHVVYVNTYEFNREYNLTSRGN
jgi:hypothetical protein